MTTESGRNRQTRLTWADQSTGMGLGRCLGLSLGLGIVLTVGGCGKPWNESIDLVGTSPLPALSITHSDRHINSEPSLTGNFDRRNWSTITVPVPTRQVAHYPTYVANFNAGRDRGPWNPAHPTASDAIVDPTNAGVDAMALFGDPLLAAGLLLWFPIDAIFFNWMWTQESSPSASYEQLPAAQPADLWDWFDFEGPPPALNRAGASDQPD